ncbi:MAG: hypothetical protein IJ106_15695, partial [Parasporobacterium sp.]|nr:hypothetical protein [Parasporobacterium sp.]
MANLLIVAEKPSVAKSIANALGVKENGKHEGYIEGFTDYFGVTVWVTWCLGHLVQMSYPEAYDPKYTRWRLEDLPLLPEEFKYEVIPETKKQFQIVAKLMNSVGESEQDKKEKSTLSRDNKFLVPFSYVVNACDAGREGELIFNRVYELSGSRMPVKRLWISSMEDSAIREGFRNLKSAEAYRNLAEASVCRAQADWLVGMNASRAFTKVYDYRLSVGRVQTPTLAMLVDRENEITNFQKQQYFMTHLLVESMGKTIDAVSEHFTDQEEANRLAGMCRGRMATVPSIERRTKTVAPPKLYDLTTLQRDANRLFGYTAAKTLECAQSLYENKLITYPRTDSNYLTDDMEQTAQAVLAACRKDYPFLAGQSGGDFTADTCRLLNSKKVSDHHAIIPTVEIRNTDLSELKKEEWNILVLAAARLLCASGKPHVYEAVKATFLCCGYSFTASGKTVKDDGWKAIWEAMKKQCLADEGDTDRKTSAGAGSDTSDENAGDQDLSSLYQGAQFPSADTKVSEHWTQPPKRYTEDTLLSAMERAGSSDMEADVERKGLGTPATRASIIDKLIQSGYAVRKKKQVIATDAGRQLISVMPEYLKSAKMTADWENQLLMIERGQYDSRSFMDGITGMLQRMLEECRQIDGDERNRFGTHKERENIGICPVCGAPVYEGKQNFYCSNRDCRFVLWKENRYLERMQKKLDAGMAKDLLAKGRTRVKDLYSAKKDKLFTADLLM